MQYNDTKYAQELMEKCDSTIKVEWTDSRIEKILRLRLLGDSGFPMLDVSYMTCQLKDGTICDVHNPFGQLPRRGFRKAIVNAAKRDGVFAKGLGIFDAISICN